MTGMLTSRKIGVGYIAVTIKYFCDSFSLCRLNLMCPFSFLRVSSPDSGLHSTSAPGSTDPAAEEPGRKFWDELGQIGLPDDINVASLFDPTGR